MIQTLFLVLVLHCVDSSNILYIGALPSPSHYLWNKVLALELVSIGHNVTMLTHDVDKDVRDNYTVISFKGFYEYSYENFDIEDLLLNSSPLNDIGALSDFIDITCDFDFKSSAFQKLLNYPENFKFDLILFDVAGPVCLYGFIPRFKNPPVIAVSAYVVSPHLSHFLGNPLYTSYTPYFSTSFTNKMTFYQRTLNFVYTYLDILTHKYIFYPRQHKVAEDAFNTTLPLFTDIQKQLGLYLVNFDPVIDYPTSLLPNIISVGGLHIKQPKCLSKDLEKVFDNAQHGVIFFSLGTNIQSFIFTSNDIKVFLDVFSKLKQTVIWKFDSNRVDNIPKNVIISKWLPQNDILGHPKTKLFITHCGALSLQETIYHAVPVVGIPYFVDQNVNIAKIQNKRIGVYLDKHNFTFENINEAVTEVLNNPRYALNIKEISEKFKNQLNSPLDRAVFWIEHVLQYGTPKHLHVPGKDMAAYKTNDFDVLLLLVLCLFGVLYSLYFILRKSALCLCNKLEMLTSKKKQ
ncbi:hypothetical protein FQR65_LT06906 [Abscondita terminalis]|nr:hypothetical protein FQR65_LT06906 [Abscondita terminalis]